MENKKELPQLFGDGRDETETIETWINAGKMPPFEKGKCYHITKSIIIPANIKILNTAKTKEK